MNKNVQYGTESLERLRRVLLHKPEESLKLVTLKKVNYHLFNNVPNIEQFLYELDQYAELLRSKSIEVLYLKDYIKENVKAVPLLPNLTYLHDTAVVTSQGAILSKMCPGTRAGEEIVLKEALNNLGIPIFHEFSEKDQFEGCLILSPETLIIVDTERHSRETIETFFDKALKLFNEIIFVEAPQQRRYMHADMIFNRISENLALAFPPAFLHTFYITANKRLEVDLHRFFRDRGMEIIEITDQEQQNWGCSFVPLEPNVLFHYDISLSLATQNKLSARGVEIIQFHPNALLAGGGSLRCHTLRLWRQN